MMNVRPTSASSQVMPILINVASKEVVVLARQATTIGRASGNDIVIAADRAVSRQHLLILAVGGMHYLEDLGSRNGTFLNDQPVRGRVVLVSGDEIRIGMTRFLFVMKADRQATLTQLAAGRTLGDGIPVPLADQASWSGLPISA